MAKNKGIIKSVSKYGLLIPVALGNLATKGLEKITKKKYGRTTAEELSKTTAGKIIGGGIVATSTALGGAVAITHAGGIATAQTIGKALIPKTPLGKTVGLLTLGGAVASPTIATAVLEAPIKVFQTGQKIGAEVEKMPEEKTKDKSALGLLLAGAGGLIAGSVAGAGISNLLEKTPEIPKESADNYLDAPIPQPYETISTTSGKKRKRKARANVQPMIKNSVKVLVNNNNRGLTISKKYIKECCYA